MTDIGSRRSRRAGAAKPSRSRGLRRRTGRTTLRRRLVLLSIGLTAVVSIVIGLVSVLSLQVFLQERLDGQLTSAVRRSREFADRPPNETSNRNDNFPGPGFLSAPGQGENTLGAKIQADGSIAADGAGVLGASGKVTELTAEQKTLVTQIPADREPHTVDLGGDLGKYRVIAQVVQQDGEQVTLVTGLPLNSVQAAVWRLSGVVTSVSVAGLLAVAVLGGLIVRRTLRPLNRVAQVASGVTALPLHEGKTSLPVRVPEQDTDPATEVGQVGAALNTLLGHVDSALQVRNASEARMRRFIADASHELRTPLASIRGYAELTRRTGQQVPPEVAHALSRVESEAIRMSGLVEELLLLARLDDGRPVAHEPVDLTHTLVNTISDAHAAGPTHRWQLNLPEVPVVVIGDEPQLHQVLVNLLANARVHTPPGTVVEAALRLSSSENGTPEALLTVTDNGPGIAPDLLPEVFGRFARGDNSRSRTAGSTGLGLSIVSAVVAAHAGQVSVTSRPGRTCFSVRLPAEPPEDLYEPEDVEEPDDIWPVEPHPGQLPATAGGIPPDAVTQPNPITRH
ncbi:two-component sensor histidine kinase [Kineosporia sp. J2-2]|uniref:histidine kinase n=1 Tax=Kineosporia corallincola TaxID=2835133 RepID=A0ABS5TR98_9ACTN|nr:ATP-binding protein [Kineosporia corallincola]MBT0773019.1 two-component sensor histidine kinase [Kineosporia corallincola]